MKILAEGWKQPSYRTARADLVLLLLFNVQ